MDISNFDSYTKLAISDVPDNVLDIYKKIEEQINILANSKNIGNPLNVLPKLSYNVTITCVELINSYLNYIDSSHQLYQLQSAALFNFLTAVQKGWSELWYLSIGLKNEERFKIFHDKNPQLAEDLREPCDAHEMIRYFNASMRELSKLRYKPEFKKEYYVHCEKQGIDTTKFSSNNSGSLGLILIVLACSSFLFI